MDFTYDSYLGLIKLLREHNYNIVSYHDWESCDKSVILRHDIDYDMDKAVELAQFESKNGVKSTFFVLLTSDFYNVFSRANREKLQKILAMGHEIGLHFDETCYDSLENVKDCILSEKNSLENVLGLSVKTLSMHRPSKQMLEMDLKVDGLVNSYGSIFFKDIKYLSDSRRRWREPVEEIVASEQYNRLQILTHAFWYNDINTDMHDTISGFVNQANFVRYEYLNDNITDLQSVMKREEIQ